MNISTLSAKTADYKSVDIPVALYQNAMRRTADGKQTYFARPISRSHLTMLDIANDMVALGLNEGLTAEQIVSLWSTINNGVFDRVTNGCTVDGGLGTYGVKVSGTFETEGDTFSKERHRIDLSFKTGKTIKEQLSAFDVVIRQGNMAKPQIADVHDLESDGANRLTPGGYLEISGINLAICGTDPSVGLYFVNTADDSKTVRLEQGKIGANMPSRLACVVPATLEAGTYQVKIVTQFSRAGYERKEPLEFVFDKAFEVVTPLV